MTHALNLVLTLRQDSVTKDRLRDLEARFEEEIQPAIEVALKSSKLVHFARVFIIDDKYIQVITEYDGSHREYTEFFREKLTPVFAAIFALAEGAPDVNDPNKFWEYAKSCNKRSLGLATDGARDFDGDPAGWLFSAYDHKTVREIQGALADADHLSDP